MVTVTHGARAGTGGRRRYARLMGATALVGGLLAGLVTGTPPAWGQWATNGANISYTNGNVSIGTTNPTSTAGWSPLLHLRGAYSGMTLDATAAGGRNYSIGSNVIGGNGVLTFFDETASTTRVVLDANGNLGIGTTDPTSPGGFAPITKIQGAYPALSLSKNTGTNRLWTMGINTGGVLSFYDETATVTRMILDTSGNVGIGTQTPAAKLHVAGDAQVDGNLAAKYQDVAEWVKSDGVLPVATVVIIDLREPNRVTTSDKAYDTRVAGVVSAKPGLLLGEGGEDKTKVAHSGRVRVKVDAQYGAIAVGDLLVTSPTLGHAMRSEPIDLGAAKLHRPGTLIGKALEPLEGGLGEILVLLTLQ